MRIPISVLLGVCVSGRKQRILLRCDGRKRKASQFHTTGLAKEENLRMDGDGDRRHFQDAIKHCGSTSGNSKRRQFISSLTHEDRHYEQAKR